MMSTLKKSMTADYMNHPDLKLLQQNVMFDRYYTCRRGMETLEHTSLKHFEVFVEYDGTRYVQQSIDELDKNHMETDRDMAKKGKM